LGSSRAPSLAQIEWGSRGLSPELAPVFWVLLAVWVLGECWLQWRRRLPSAAVDRDAGSKAVLVAAVWLAVGVGLFGSEFLPGLSLGASRNQATVVGLVLMVAGLGVRWWAVAVLGSAFTVAVGIQVEQKLVVSGPYRLVRHPSYSGSLLTVIGVALCWANWLALAALLLPFAAYAYRIQVEERALLTGLGPAYSDYRARTHRLVPWLL